MDTNLLYDRVCAVKKIGQENFLDHLNYTVTELCSIYGEEWVMAAPFRRTERVGEAVQVKDIFSVAVEDNILYLMTGDERHKTDFTAHAKYAYNTLWRQKNTGRRIRREGW